MDAVKRVWVRGGLPEPEDREESSERQNPRRRLGYDLTRAGLDSYVVHAHLESQHPWRQGSSESDDHHP
jgi:hypothetical protein